MDQKRDDRTPPQTRLKGVDRQQHLMHMLSSDTTVISEFSKAFGKVDHGVLLFQEDTACTRLEYCRDLHKLCL